MGPIGEPFALFKAPPKGKGMQFGEGKKADQFLESLKAEGEVMLEDVHVPSAAQSKLAVVATTDPITLTIEERLNVAIARDGGLNSFDVQGALFLQVLNHEDSFIQLQVRSLLPKVNEMLANKMDHFLYLLISHHF